MINIRNVLADEWKFIFKNKRMFVILFLVPILYAMLFGAVYSHHKITEVKIVVFDGNQSLLSRQLIQSFDASPLLNVIQQVNSEIELTQSIENGQAYGGIIIPSQFDTSLKKGESEPILTIVDGSNMMITNTVTKAANEVVTTFSYGITSEKLKQQGLQEEQMTTMISAIPFRYRVLYNPTYNYSDFLVYGMIGLTLQQVLFLVIGLTVSREKETGSWLRYAVWREHPWKLAFAKSFPYFIASVVNVLTVSLVASYVFGLTVRGSILSILLLALCFSFAVAGLGYLVSFSSKHQVEAIQTGMLIAMPSFVLSGYTWPLEEMPHLLRLIGQWLPLTHFLHGLREIYIKGHTIDTIGDHCITLCLIGLISYLAAMLITRFISFPSSKPQNDKVRLNQPKEEHPMKKIIPGLCLLLVLMQSFPVHVMATDQEEEERVQHVYVYTPDLQEVDAIDLPTVLERGLEQSHNLALLLLKQRALQAKENDLLEQESQLKTAPITRVALPDTPQEMIDLMNAQGVVLNPQEQLWLGPVTTGTNYALNQTIAGMANMTTEINQFIRQQRNQLETTAHQLYTDQLNNELQYQEAKEGIRLQLIAQYTHILGLKQQLDFMHQYDEHLEKEVSKAISLELQGLATSDDVRQAKDMKMQHEDNMNLVQQNYDLALIQLCYDIGIAYHPDLEVKDIDDFSITPVKEVDVETLLKHSYQMKIAANDVEESWWQEDETVTQNVYGNDYLDYQVAISMVSNSQKQLELTKKIYANYSDAQQAYDEYMALLREWEKMKNDRLNMQIRYEVGIISKFDYNKFQIQLAQSETALQAAKLKYYAMKEKALAMERGFI